MTPIAKTSGELSTNGVVRSQTGLLTYAEAVGGDVSLYEGSTSGNRICTLKSSQSISFDAPLQFGSTGLYITVSAGYGVVHTA